MPLRERVVLDPEQDSVQCAVLEAGDEVLYWDDTSHGRSGPGGLPGHRPSMTNVRFGGDRAAIERQPGLEPGLRAPRGPAA